MTESELLSRPRYLYEVAAFVGLDKRTLLSRVGMCGVRLPDTPRLLLPHQVRRILDCVYRYGLDY